MFLPSCFEEWEVRVYYKKYSPEAREAIKTYAIINETRLISSCLYSLLKKFSQWFQKNLWNWRRVSCMCMLTTTKLISVIIIIIMFLDWIVGPLYVWWARSNKASWSLPLTMYWQQWRYQWSRWWQWRWACDVNQIIDTSKERSELVRSNNIWF